VLLFIDGDLRAQRFRSSFHLLDANFYARQLVQHPAALFEAQ